MESSRESTFLLSSSNSNRSTVTPTTHYPQVNCRTIFQVTRRGDAMMPSLPKHDPQQKIDKEGNELIDGDSIEQSKNDTSPLLPVPAFVLRVRAR